MKPGESFKLIRADHAAIGRYLLACEGADALLFTENESNIQRLFGSPNPTPYVKDAFHAFLIDRKTDAVNPEHEGTKAAAWYHHVVGPGEFRRSA